MKLEHNIEAIWKPIKWVLITLVAVYFLYMMFGQIFAVEIRQAKEEGFENGRRYERSLMESNKSIPGKVKKQNIRKADHD